MRARDRFFYGVGGFGKNIAYTVVSTYTLYYYNTVLGISASFVGTLLLMARIFDAFNDPFMGVVVEKTRSRFGKYKPWILSGAVLNAFVLFAMFSVPDNMSVFGTKFYITITYFLCGITYTLSDIPYWSVIPAITQAGPARERISIVARTFTGVGTGVATVFTMMIVVRLGGGTTIADYKQGFSLLAAIVAVVYIVTTVLAVMAIPSDVGVVSEAGASVDTSELSVKHLLKALVQNDQALVLSLIVILFYSATNLTLSTVIYEFDYELLMPQKYSSFMAAMGIAQFAGMTLIYTLLRKVMSNRGVFFAACAFAVLGYACFAFEIPVVGISYIQLLGPGVLVAVANGIVYVLVTILVANAVDYGEKKSGVRENSMISALQTLMVKFASAISAWILGIGIDLVGFVGEGMQEAEVLQKLHVLVAVPPLVLVGVAAMFLLKRKDI